MSASLVMAPTQGPDRSPSASAVALRLSPLPVPQQTKSTSAAGLVKTLEV